MKKIILGLALSGLLGTAAMASDAPVYSIANDAPGVVDILMSPKVSNCLSEYDMAVAEIDTTEITIQEQDFKVQEYRFSAMADGIHNQLYGTVTMVVEELPFYRNRKLMSVDYRCRVILPQDIH